MKRLAGSIFLLCVVLMLCACAKDDSRIFMATVIENTDALIVEPRIDTMEYTTSDKIVVHTENAVILNANKLEITVSEIAVGQSVQITYNGVIAESYPAQIWADKITIVEK